MLNSALARASATGFAEWTNSTGDGFAAAGVTAKANATASRLFIGSSPRSMRRSLLEGGLFLPRPRTFP
jgi:hypothetical protein